MKASSRGLICAGACGPASQDGTMYRYLNLNATGILTGARRPFEISRMSRPGQERGKVIYDHFTRRPYCNVIRTRSGAVGAHWTEDVSRLQPVLVVTPYRADANLVTELLRGFASTIVTRWAQTAEAAVAVAASRSPRLVFVGSGRPRPADGLGVPPRVAAQQPALPRSTGDRDDQPADLAGHARCAKRRRPRIPGQAIQRPATRQATSGGDRTEAVDRDGVIRRARPPEVQFRWRTFGAGSTRRGPRPHARPSEKASSAA